MSAHVNFQKEKNVITEIKELEALLMMYFIKGKYYTENIK